MHSQSSARLMRSTGALRSVGEPGLLDAIPVEGWVTALCALDGMGPKRLVALLGCFEDPRSAWDAVSDGQAGRILQVCQAIGAAAPAVIAAWAHQANQCDVAAVWRRHVEFGVGVSLRGEVGYPSVFADDIEPPVVLFHQGDPDVVVGPRVAIVGTRDCTNYGYEIAFDLAHDLSQAGVSIVSGLALGIDSAAHAGAISADGAPPIGVVGSGLDVFYPRRNGPLWREVARRGVVWSEYPLGTAALAWHFPARNRLIAALADVVVVVESHAAGGALLTADAALERGHAVMAVPGPVRSAASDGTNELLASGGSASVARDASDVLIALGMAPGSRRKAIERRSSPSNHDRVVLDAVGWQPANLDDLVARTGRSIPDLAASVARLEESSWLARRGGWLERVAKPGGP